ncbi:MAG TPA: hypothetical protein ENO23_01170 [Alphaproteobacteria bacterium]|nr:hypothetical protein [Alphaproteobacteria bacterium]
MPIVPSLEKLLDATLGHEIWMYEAVGMNVVVMFVGNFGEQQGRRMELGGELPAHLMARVESGA